MSNEISSCRRSRNTVTLSKNRSTCSIRQCCFDIVAGVDGACTVAELMACWRVVHKSLSSVLTAAVDGALRPK